MDPRVCNYVYNFIKIESPSLIDSECMKGKLTHSDSGQHFLVLKDTHPFGSAYLCPSTDPLKWGCFLSWYQTLHSQNTSPSTYLCCRFVVIDNLQTSEPCLNRGAHTFFIESVHSQHSFLEVN